MNILVVDDDALQRDLLKGFLEKQGYDVLSAGDGKAAIRLFRQHPFQVVLMDNRMPGESGDTVMEKIKKINPLVRIIMITAFGSIHTAVRVMKLGADDFLEKPVDLVNLLEKIQAIEQSLQVDDEAKSVADAIQQEGLPIQVIGKSAATKDILSLVRRIAPTSWPVLIQGESGTGKEMIARLIHLLSPRQDKSFVEVNCAAIPETLFESELFGHEKGSFTGAIAMRRGWFELAINGTIFFDEIAELSLNLQAKLLRVLQEQKISRVGGEQQIAVDTRIIAATNRDLKNMVAEGRFREDLYYRINVLDIEIKPLRNRKEDIPDLIEYFLNRYSPQPVNFDADAMGTLIKYSFPGNVRELEHIIQRIVTLSRQSVIRERDLPAEIRFHHAAEHGTLAERLKATEREMIYTALENYDWIQTRAAESLGISERVFRYKMKKHGIKQLKK